MLKRHSSRSLRTANYVVIPSRGAHCRGELGSPPHFARMISRSPAVCIYIYICAGLWKRGCAETSHGSAIYASASFESAAIINICGECHPLKLRGAVDYRRIVGSPPPSCARKQREGKIERGGSEREIERRERESATARDGARERAYSAH